MNTTEVNLSKITTNKNDEPDPSQSNDSEKLQKTLEKIVSQKYRISLSESKMLISQRFNKLKDLSIQNPDKILRTYNIKSTNDEGIYKYLIENMR